MSGEVDLAQPEESFSRMVMENSAWVWSCSATRPRELARNHSVWLVEKTPAAV